MDITFEPMKADEWEEAFRLRSIAFGGPLVADVDRPRLPTENMLVARSAGDLVGTAALAICGQSFNGRVLPMGAVASIAVAPQATRRGVAKQLMRGLFELMVDQGLVISTLFPSTSPLYRSLGYESAGLWTQRSLPLTDLETVMPYGIEVHEGGPASYQAVRHLHEKHARRTHGWLVRNDWFWAVREYLVANPERHTRVFVASSDDEPVAFAAVANTDATRDPRASFDLELVDAFGDPKGLAAICATLASSATIASELLTTLEFDDVAEVTQRPERLRVESQEVWMTRILDVSEALAARGGGTFEGALHLDVSDPEISANDGRFVVTHTGGEVIVETGGEGGVAVSINDLSAMFTGFRSPRSLAIRGRLGSATASDINALTALFAAPLPTMSDSF